MAFTATPASFTPINIWAMLRALINNNTPILNFSGVPVNGVNGTFAGQAGPGALLIDFVNANLYINVGTLVSPNWSREISSVTGGVVQYLPFVNTGLFAEFFNEGIVATGSSQNTSAPITGAIARVTAGGGGVQLPPAVGGLDVMVINHTGADITVYGVIGDTINDIPTGVGVNLMNDSFAIFATTGGGRWYSADLATGYSRVTGLQTLSFSANVVSAGLTQATATQLTKMMNRVSTVALGAGVALPMATPGEFVVINNRGLNPLQVYGNALFPGDTINGVITTTGVTQPVNSIVTYTCFITGNWEISFVPGILVNWVSLTTNGAIPVASTHYMITKPSALSDTIAAPLPSPFGDGIDITISSDSAFSHTITFTGGSLDSGGSGSTTILFNPNKGSSFRVVSFNSRWKLQYQNGVSIS